MVSDPARVRRVGSALLVALTLWLGAVLAGDGVGTDRLGLEPLFEGVVALVREAYWDPEHVDWDAWAEGFRDEALASPDRVRFDAVMGRMLRALGDGHSRWLGLAEVAPEAAPDAPVDAPLRLGCACVFVAGRGLLVERVFAATPAAAAGLMRGDVVVAVDGEALAPRGSLVAAMTVVREALERGAATLLVERRRRSLELVLEGAPMVFAEAAARPYGLMLDAFTGYLQVPTFQRQGVAAEAHAALDALQRAGAVGLVLDLRANQGGRLLEAGALLAAFGDGVWAEGFARGAVAWRADAVRGGAAVASRLVASDGAPLATLEVEPSVRWGGTVVVVVDRATTSVAEVVAAALQRSARAWVVGEGTGGNVEAVQGFTLVDGSRLLLAIADLRGADGAPYAVGVVPDVVSRSERGALALGRDLPVLEARRLLGGLPFVPDARF